MTHPTKPVDLEFHPESKEENLYYNAATKDNTWLSKIHFDPIDFFCARTNCPFCLKSEGDTTVWKEASEELRVKTLTHLKKLRKMAQISFNSLLITLMNSSLYDDDDYDYDNDNGDYAILSARIEELEEENKLLDEMPSSSSS
jgi:hypothetical protein